MKIEMTQLTVRDVVAGYIDKAEDGVFGYGGKLNIRPPFQREFVYKDKQRNEVINTILQGFPLNVMYWSKSDDDNYELLDGQQRTVSFCKFVCNEFSVSVNGHAYTFANLTKEEQDKFLDYPLMIYVCEGTFREKLDWFKVVNIAGVELTMQELRNAVFTGPWLFDAKRRFSKTNCVAYKLAADYMTGSPIRQDYLETALAWVADKECLPGKTDAEKIEHYMSQHQLDAHANPLWLYFQEVIAWVIVTFPHRRREMKGVEWGLLYNQHHDANLNPNDLESRIVRLLEDDDVTRKSGVYAYVLDDDERHLSIRAFTPKMRREAYERQHGICANCGKHFDIEDMEADHITPWSKGGRTTAENCQMLCKDCNRRKGDR